MDYSINFNDEGDICTVHVTGICRRPDDSIALQQLARGISEERDCERFLFDLRDAEVVGGTVATFEVGTVPLDSTGSQKSQRVALVYAGDMKDHEFMQTVGVNRGYNFQVFSDISVANEWFRAVSEGD